MPREIIQFSVAMFVTQRKWLGEGDMIKQWGTTKLPEEEVDDRAHVSTQISDVLVERMRTALVVFGSQM